MQGKPVLAMQEEARSLRWAAEIDHLGSFAHARDMQLLHRVFRRDHEAVLHRAAEMVTLGSEHGIADARGKGLIFHGWAMALRGAPADGLRALEEGFALQQATGTTEDFPIYVCLLAEAMIAAGQPERAAAILAAAEAEYAQQGLRFWRSELRRMRAEAVLGMDASAVASAVTLFDEAQAIAEEQGVTMLALRAATGAAALDVRRDEPHQARARLLPILSRIEGYDGSPDLVEAHAVSSRLAAIVG